jgi:S-DNA-T family DNA segregation ATPase FtsK/SpoIIIE
MATAKSPAKGKSATSSDLLAPARFVWRAGTEGLRYYRTHEPEFIAGAAPLSLYAVAADVTDPTSAWSLFVGATSAAGALRYYGSSDHARRNRAMRKIGRALVEFELTEPSGEAPRMKNLVFTPAGRKVDLRVPRRSTALLFTKFVPFLEDELNATVRVEQIAAPKFGPAAALSAAAGKVRARKAGGDDGPAPVKALVPRGGVRLTIVERDTLVAPLPDLWPVLVPGPDGLIPARRWYDPLPIAKDEDGNTVDLSFAKRPAILVGGESGSGKSVFTHEVVGGWLLDPRARLLGWDGKGELEFTVYQGLADEIVGPDPVVGTELLKLVRAEMTRREAYLRSIGEEQADPDDPECYPLLLALEELTAYSKHPEFWEVLLYLLVRVRAVNMRMILTIQRPSSTSMPTDVRDNVGMKVAHSVTTPESSDMCLGKGWAANGWNAQQIPLDESGQFAGINLLLTDGSAGPRRTRSWPVLRPQRELVVARARELRGLAQAGPRAIPFAKTPSGLAVPAPRVPANTPVPVAVAPEPKPAEPSAADVNRAQAARRVKRNRPSRLERRLRAVDPTVPREES